MRGDDVVKPNKKRICDYAALLMHAPHASALLKGSAAFSEIQGVVQFYRTEQGIVVAAQICGLPTSENLCRHPVFGFHIHDGGYCEGDAHDPFSKAMSHYDPADCAHPYHAGDLPPLFGSGGYAFSVFLTNRFTLSEVIGKAAIIHGNPDDFTTQPSGNAGIKMACGVIESCKNACRGCNDKS